MIFVQHRALFPAVKEFLKSVVVWSSYIENKSVAVLFETQCEKFQMDVGWSMSP